MSNFGIKASPPGIDVTKAIDEQLSFNSQYPLFKIAIAGRTTSTNSGSTLKIHHGLGYIPIFICTASGAASQNANDRYLCDYRNAGGEKFTAYADTEDLNVDVSFGTAECNIFYYIFYDPGK